MKLTEENKNYIDKLTYQELLERWRFAPIGDLWFQDETGCYWKWRMNNLRSQPGGEELHIKVSKLMGWEV